MTFIMYYFEERHHNVMIPWVACAHNFLIQTDFYEKI
jgi:hypothetical protein